MNTPTEDNLERLAKALMVTHSLSYPDAVLMLGRFKLNISCSVEITSSVALQAGLLTAINTGKRAFHGGVTVCMPSQVPLLLRWPGCRTLNEVAARLGADFGAQIDSPFSQTLFFGHAPVERIENSLQVVCSGWLGGVVPTGHQVLLKSDHDFATGGVAAAALAVAHGFLRISGINSHPITAPQGISLWRPDLDWTDSQADGPALEILPNNLWMLGLGHLGQGYLWNFSFLPYADPSSVHFLLQDFDKAVKGNFSSGLLCEPHNEGKRKTRLSSDWLEERDFKTTIVERRFDANTIRHGDEPYVACCGFDSAESRTHLESAGFDLVVECALGSDTPRFDRIILHTFPDASKKATEIWSKNAAAPVNGRIVEAFKTKGDCGILAETLARKAISTSFSGAFAGTLVTGELLRALHGGFRYEYIHAHLRHGEGPKVIIKPENYMNRIARAGFSATKTLHRMAA